jgi:hypothetical protein
MEPEVIEQVKLEEFIFHCPTETGMLIVRIKSDSKENAIKEAQEEFMEWAVDNTFIPDSHTVYLGSFNYEIEKDGTMIVEQGEVVDFSQFK